MTTWIAIVGVALATFLTRASFIVFVDPERFPVWFRESLKYVPPAVLAAIVAPGLLMPANTFDASPSNLRLLAGLVAIGASFKWRNTMAPIAAGMASLWLLEWLRGHLT